MEIASCIVIYTLDGRFLLQKRDANAQFFPNCWGLVGGASENEESPLECIRRECYEETNWTPENAKLLFVHKEHCIEYVYTALLEISPSSLIPGEGECLCFYTYEEASTLNWSTYHRRLFERAHRLLKKQITRSKKSVLLYTKVLTPAIGGYVAAGESFIDAFKDSCDLTVVVDAPIISISKHNSGFKLITLDECKTYPKSYFDLLFFNSTYEHTNTLNLLMYHCREVWCFEHNHLSPTYRKEMLQRFGVVNRVFVPSLFLKESFEKSLDTHFDVQVLPIPINPELFYYSSHRPNGLWRIVSVCMIKRVRRIESLIDIALFLKKNSIRFKWDILGDIPFQGESCYLEELKSRIHESNLENDFNLMGPVAHENIGRLFHNYDVFVDYSSHETYGQAKLEAIFSGLIPLIPNIENNVTLVSNRKLLLSPSLSQFCRQVMERLKMWEQHSDELFNERLENWGHVFFQYSLQSVRNLIDSLLYEEI